MGDPRMTRQIRWIADEDEPTWLDVEEVAGMISVALVADTWDVDAEFIAQQVVAIRKSQI